MRTFVHPFQEQRDGEQQPHFDGDGEVEDNRQGKGGKQDSQGGFRLLSQ
ncbi:hypothetical protein SDC9_128479 [bioreactor metagenome]|uniref:Uncharacterized protein n=1 Tax=bioreactor metagenome TaxID=1076179 RepID=A0A645CWB9_9ZZZZ